MPPREFDYIMPGEFAHHQRTFIEWPVKESLCWPDNFQEVCSGYARVVKAIAAFEPVTIIVNPGEAHSVAKQCGLDVEIIEIEHDDAWFRDNGPTFITDNIGNVAGVNWNFNAWGEKYAPWD